MAFDKYSTEPLKKTSKLLLGLSIVILTVTIFLLVFGMYQTKQGGNKTLIFLVPTVFGPLTILSSLLAASMGAEVKKREKGHL
ncbi:hypothetical protein [Flagellimonas allohymeniacidonis]|uniref:Uncharacterized protein n=1 Tax=Flagellimonas allohymeniacidonis TaxID=2517819 RepID=A0A4Q8QF95_9FLAO|nr:hypothetical protein [Allomuricauda hymeniacidonis]TAI49192.1 hypothetical protein EW142_05185 [Allomuricauda hymeniacidonis]